MAIYARLRKLALWREFPDQDKLRRPFRLVDRRVEGIDLVWLKALASKALFLGQTNIPRLYTDAENIAADRVRKAGHVLLNRLPEVALTFGGFVDEATRSNDFKRTMDVVVQNLLLAVYTYLLFI